MDYIHKLLTATCYRDKQSAVNDCKMILHEKYTKYTSFFPDEGCTIEAIAMQFG